MKTGITSAIRNRAGAIFLAAVFFFPAITFTAQGQESTLGGNKLVLNVEAKDDGHRQVLPSTRDIRQAAETIRKRLEAARIKSPDVTVSEEQKILVNLSEAGKDKSNSLKEIITGKISLRFLTVHPDNDALLAAKKESVPTYKLYVFSRDGEEEKLFLSKRETVTEKDIESLNVDPVRQGIINVTLTMEGGNKMKLMTGMMAKGKDRLAIVLNDVVLSAPTVQDTIARHFQISGLKTAEKAETTAIILNHPLEFPLTILEQHP